MGHYVYETYDPEMLDIPNDFDFEEEGVDEAYESYSEYRAYIPDPIEGMAPASQESLCACEAALQEIAHTVECLHGSPVEGALEELLLYVEAVASARAENYRVSCSSALEYEASRHGGVSIPYSEGELAALDAAEALRTFALENRTPVTLDDICEANRIIARTSSRADECGSLRERPVFIGASLFDAEYVAPPEYELEPLMADLVNYINGSSSHDPIAKAAIAHVQFVTIHPFEDGNGRTARAISQRVLASCNTAAGLTIPVTAVMMARHHDYIDAIHSLVNPGGPADPSVFVEYFAESCRLAALWIRSMQQGLETILARWSEVSDTTDPAQKHIAEAFLRKPVISAAALLDKLGPDALCHVGKLVDEELLHAASSRFSGTNLYFATDVLSLVDTVPAEMLNNKS